MPSRWLIAVSAAGFSVGVAALAASCGGGGSGGGTTELVNNDPPATTGTTGVSNVPPTSSSDGGDAGAASCGGGTSPGCACATVGQQISCGQVHRVSGSYVSCSPGFQTCNANGQWGACLGDRVGDPRGPSRGYLLDSLQLDASTCSGNLCDPSCQGFTDNAAGLDAGPDSGLVFADSGISLAPIYPDSGVVCTGFTIAPLNQTITVQTLPTTTDPPNSVPMVSYSGGQQYSATAIPVGCFTDVVPALWGMDRNDIGTFDSTTGFLTVFTGVATLAPVNIAAFVGGLTAQYTTATIIVDAHDTSAAGGFATSFSSAGSGSDPAKILYPYDGTVLPLGLQPPIVQWSNNGQPADAVAITLRYPDTSPVFSWQGITATESPPTTTVPGLETASGLAAAPRYAIDANVWSDFEQTAKGNATTMAQPAIISVQRISGGHLYQEEKIKVFFAPGQLKGKVFYQSYETQLVKNSDYVLADGSQVGAATLAISPGDTEPTLVAGVTGSTAGEGCRVCHTLSGDGSTLLTQNGHQLPDGTSLYGQTRYYDIATGAPNDVMYTSDTSGIFAWAALTQNAAFGVSNAGAGIAIGPGTSTSTLYNMSVGTPIAPIGVQMTTPSFAPNDSQITFNYWNYDSRSLGIMNFDEGALSFSGLQAVYTPPSGQVVWPTYTPGSNQIIFGTQYTGNYGYTWSNSTADLWRYDSGSGQAARMNNANGVGLPSGGSHTGSGDAQLNFEPTMNPTPVAQTGGFAWVVFTSRRLFGNVAVLDPYCSDARTCDDRTSPTPKKLWMAAVNPGVTGGADPSAPAFYLPGQELLAGNSRGFWVLNQCAPAGVTAANACDTDLDCCQSPAQERCVAANSIPPIKKFCTAIPMLGTCAPDNTACTNISQCCGALTGSQCILGTCTPPPPLVTFSGASFTRDYVGTCPEGLVVVWQLFGWESYTPGNSSIVFTAQTAPDASDIVGMTPPPVEIATAESNVSYPVPAQTPGLVQSPLTVDQDLRAAGQMSSSTLRVTAYLKPATAPSQTPVLEDWQATYDCEPNQ